ncbi:hypothetical protein AOCH_003333 [Aspergillus ochraceoroseus]|uniref:FAD/NAD(P)-binding domain-containing protein n=1 Tax=Aspergillus ochraceoroseus TaxID=138278 RepID=A0A0F8VQ28_9EURO|nr:hypothetical protein AOCH_003333 [Aspergillus ochraceoroseus]
MLKPQKVAIIGAGPSGLVMAKTLLHNFPEGTFSPTVFEQHSKVGGLWSVDFPSGGGGTDSPPPKRGGLVDPLMRTNLSRFTVAFSDLAWGSVLQGERVPMFPRAGQVGLYLEKYAERYLAADVLRVGCRVIRTVREQRPGDGRWRVEWNSHRKEEVESERFDFLVVASGHFRTPYIPDIPGMNDFMENVIHSSELQSAADAQRLLEKSKSPSKPGGSPGKLVVVGGSMSGTEAASALALHVSSSRLDSRPGSPERNEGAANPEVHHICTRPYWVLPTYLPRRSSRDERQAHTMPFLPLDLVLYDLGRRAPGAVEFALGPTSPDQVSSGNQYFTSLLGNEYSRIGGIGTAAGDPRPAWVTIGDDYAEYVRSGAIKITTGRACTVHSSPSGRATIDIQLSDGRTGSLENVAAIVMATGFTPFESLSFLPEDVLSLLEFSHNDQFLPLILDGKGSSHADIPDLGFVGFYRGAFWGPMEMQAQRLAEQWARRDQNSESSLQAGELNDRTRERQQVRAFRNADPTVSRGQFPMADYVGSWSPPVRYAARSDCHGAQSTHDEIQNLRQVLLPGSGPDSSLPCTGTGTAMAIFRALHGQWKFTRAASSSSSSSSQVADAERGDQVSGQATFQPRYPSSPGYEREYVYKETGSDPDSDTQATQSTWRLYEDTSIPGNGAQILIWAPDPTRSPNEAPEPVHELRILPAELDSTGPHGRGDLIVRTRDVRPPGSCGDLHEYSFHLNGVAISSWEHAVLQNPGGGGGGGGGGVERSKTVYER